MGEDGSRSDVSSGAGEKPVYEMRLTLDPGTSEFEVNTNFPGVVLQIGMLEYALVMVKRAEVVRQQQVSPLVVPAGVVLTRKN